MVNLRRRHPDRSPPTLPPQQEEPKTTKKKSSSSGSDFSFRVLNCTFLVKGIVMLAIIPPLMNYAALQREGEELKPKDDLFEIGFGQKYFMQCRGDGLPTVILDASTGASSDVWTLVQAEVAKHARVCIYDRAGLGFSDEPYKFNMSDPGEEVVAKTLGPEYSTLRMVQDLHRLVTISNPQPSPYIMVGSELGALNVLAFSRIHPELVTQLVLIDPIGGPLFEDTAGVENSWHKFLNNQQIPFFQTLVVTAAFGINRFAIMVGLLTPSLFKRASDLPEEIKIRQKYLLANPKHLAAVYEEYVNLNVSWSQVKYILKTTPKNAPKIGTTVLTGNYYDELLPSTLNRAWSRSAQNLISSIPGCKHIVVNGVDHSMIYAHPEEIVNPIKKLINQWKKTGKS